VILSGLYCLAIGFRNLCYKVGVFKTFKLYAKVISVGNITWGGTGKTSFVSFLAKNLAQKNQKIAILIRGYKRKGKGMVILENGIEDVDWRRVGDEAYLLGSSLGSVPVIIEKDRVKSGKYAIDKYSAKYLVLDDGFQYRRLSKNINIIMLDAQDPFGNKMLIPAGKLREPLANIKMADIVVLNNSKLAKDKKQLLGELRKYNPTAPIIETEQVVESICDLNEEHPIQLNEIKDKKILAFCGIGNPESFRATVRDLGVDILDFVVFPDHYVYKNKDIQLIVKKALDKKADFILTTQKDKIRLTASRNFEIPIYFVRIDTRIIRGQEDLWKMIYE